MNARLLRVVGAALLCACIAFPASAAEPGRDPATGNSAAVVVPESVTAEQLKARIEALEGGTQLDQATRDQALELYQLALTRLQDAESYAEAARRYQRLLQAAPEQAEEIRQALQSDAPPPDWEPLPPPEAPLEALKQRLAQEKARLAALQSEYSALDTQITDERARPPMARDELAAARLELEEVQRELRTPPPEGEAEVMTEARRTLLQARRLALTNLIDNLEQELLSHEPRLDLLTARRAALSEQRALAQQRVGGLEELVNARSRSAAAEAAAEAERAAAATRGKHPVLRETAVENNVLSRELSGLVAQIERLAQEQAAIGDQLQQLESSYRSTRQQLEIAGLSDVLGEVLLRERRQLPEVDHYQRQAMDLQQQIAEARLALFRLNERRQQLNNIPALVAELMADRVALTAREEEQPEIRTALIELLRNRRELLDTLATNYSRYVDQLAELSRDQRRLLAQAEQYAVLLDENLLWIASSAPVTPAWLEPLAVAASDLLRPAGWWSALAQLYSGVRLHPLPILGFLVTLSALLRLRRPLRRRLAEIQKEVGNVFRDRFAYTSAALLLTLLLVIPAPATVAFVGWLLAAVSEPASFSYAVGQGLRSAGIVLFLLLLLGASCRPQGLAVVHFRWPVRLCRQLRPPLRWLVPLLSLCAFVVALAEASADPSVRDTVGRAGFVAGQLILALFAWRWVKPGRLLPEHGGARGWRRLVQRGLRPLSVTLPLALTALALAGYYYTALQLGGRLFASVWLLVAVVVGVALVLRWLRLTERRLRLARARSRREAALKENAEGESAEPLPEQEMAIEQVDEQTRQLLQLIIAALLLGGLWLIWADLLPALNILNEIVLWHRTVAGEDGELLEPITLGSAVLALLLIAGTFLVIRNLPGLLEISLLRRVQMDPGNRYAVTTLTRYLIVGISALAALSLVGIGWGQAQWLVAALGVGLGFGLQEIFANFVSGLIILFERPIRVGDTVTVGDRSGTVSRIRIRATTITDWEQRELIIPNKSFVTDQLINWTLSDPITRLLIIVRIPYGSDTDRIQALLEGVVAANPLVLDEPASSVYLLGFDDSNLRFEVRVFVRDMDDRLRLSHELHTAFARTLAANGVEIPYPQRDIHIRTQAPAPPPR